MTESWIVVAVAAVLGFFVGAINPASIIATVRHADLRQGSGNPGATNVGRVLGVRWGVVVGVLDVLKGLVPTLLALWLVDRFTAYVVGLACRPGARAFPVPARARRQGRRHLDGRRPRGLPMVRSGDARGLRADAVAHAVGGWFLARGRGTARAVCRVRAAAGTGRRWQVVGDLHRPARHRPPPPQHSRLGSVAAWPSTVAQQGPPSWMGWHMDHRGGFREPDGVADPL